MMAPNQSEFKARVIEWAKRLQVSIRSVTVRPMVRKWGSISRAGNVTFSTDVLRLDPELQNYVIVHELLHVSVPNHGKLWKSLMRTHFENHEELEIKLREVAFVQAVAK